MKQALIILIIVVLSFSGCERDSSKSVMDSSIITQNNQASLGVKVAVTADQKKASEAQMASQPITTQAARETVKREFEELSLDSIRLDSSETTKWKLFN